MRHKNSKTTARDKRRQRIRAKIYGTADTPRLAVFKSNQHIYGQLIDDATGVTLVSCSTMDKELKGKTKATLAGAKTVGERLAEKAIQKGIQKVVFDRGGYRYHGKLKSLAEGAREKGLKF